MERIIFVAQKFSYMLTRRHIRIKVMQSVYSFSSGKEKKLKDEVLFFKQSVAQTFELYLLLLALFNALKRHVSDQLIAYEKHQIKIDKKYLRLERLAQNKVLQFFYDHQTLQKHLKNKKFIKWDLEFKFLNDLIDEMTKTDSFQAYLEIEDPTEKDDLQWLSKCFKESIAPSSYLFDYLEDNQLTWIDDLPVVNTFMVKMLKQLDTKDSKSLKFPKPNENQEDLTFGVTLLKRTIEEDEKLQKELKGKTPNWDAERIAKLDGVILKIAIVELLHFPEIPSKVTLNEYLEIVKDYSTPNSNNFVNGVLDKLVREFIQEKRMIKIGRGLL